MAKQKKPSGFIIYRGPSLINGRPIVAVAITKRSTNTKTGNMVQTYILADNGLSPVESAKRLEDEAICGSCPHRRGLGGSCYVNLGQGPRSVMASLIRGIYPEGLSQAAEESRGRMVRLGTYGDPAAVPLEIWETLLEHSAGHTGYTHQWRTLSGLEGMRLMALVMASADNPADRLEAKARGYRTFRVMPSGEASMPGEFTCPASAEAGKRKTCAECGACNGGVNMARKADPVIMVHGALASRFKVEQVAA